MRGKRVVVVGGSSGVGRGVATRAGEAGAEVIVAARRIDRLAAVAAEAPGVDPVVLDVRDEGSCAAFARHVADRFDAVDVLFVSSGSAPLRPYRATSTDDWMQAVETNVLGPHRVIAGLLDLLVPASITAVVSSESVDEPRSHLGAYGASKAALEHMIAQWREEHPWLRFSIVSLGATVPTEFGSGFDHGTLTDAIGAWGAAGRNQAAFMSTPEVSDLLSGILGLLVAAPSVAMPRIVLRSPSPPERDVGSTMATAAAARDSTTDGDR